MGVILYYKALNKTIKKDLLLHQKDVIINTQSLNQYMETVTQKSTLNIHLRTSSIKQIKGRKSEAKQLYQNLHNLRFVNYAVTHSKWQSNTRKNTKKCENPKVGLHQINIIWCKSSFWSIFKLFPTTRRKK